jgi:hypothetical protein
LRRFTRANLIKGAYVLLITAVLVFSTVAVTANTDVKSTTSNVMNKYIPESNPVAKGVFNEGFESYPDFVLDFPPWIQHDLDGGSTWSVAGQTFPNQNYVGSFIIFNPYEVVPDEGEEPFSDGQEPHSGNKYAACFDAVTDSAPNDDWLITPQLTLETGSEFSFWGKSLNDQYGLEEIEVGISTTDSNPSSFDELPGGYIEVPIEWTQYTFDLSQYAGMDVHLAINVISYDVFAFFLDDIMVTNVAIPTPDLECDGSLTWPDVAIESTVTGSFTVSNVGEAESSLNWEVSETPEWGTWTITPPSGGGLTPEAGALTVQVSVIAPPDKNTEFSGDLILTNLDDSSDTCTIPVSLITPHGTPLRPILLQYLENHPLMFPILRQILGL